MLNIHRFLGNEKHQNGTTPDSVGVILLHLYRPMYFEAIDFICCSIQTRFDQPGFQENLQKMINFALNVPNFNIHDH